MLAFNRWHVDDGWWCRFSTICECKTQSWRVFLWAWSEIYGTPWNFHQDSWSGSSRIMGPMPCWNFQSPMRWSSSYPICFSICPTERRMVRWPYLSCDDTLLTSLIHPKNMIINILKNESNGCCCLFTIYSVWPLICPTDWPRKIEFEREEETRVTFLGSLTLVCYCV